MKKHNLSDIFIWVLIVVFVITFVGIIIACARSEVDSTNVENVKIKPNSSRMILVEKTSYYSIFYDKYTNVMYGYIEDGGFCPIYNSDGTLHLYGDDRTVG